MNPISQADRRQTVAIVAYDFTRALAGGSNRALGFARHLPAAGWDVVVCTASPVEEAGPVAAERGVRVLSVDSPERSWGGGIRVERGDDVHALGANPSWLRALAPLSRHLPIERQWAWIPRAVRTFGPILRDLGVTVVLSMAPPTASPVVGHRLARSLGVGHVVDLRDDWVDLARIQGRSALHRTITEFGLGRILAGARAVSTVSRVIADRLAERGFPATLIENGYQEADFEGVGMEGAAVATTGPLDLVHVGWLGAFRSAGPLLDAIARRAAVRGGEPGIRFTQVGLIEPGELALLTGGSASRWVHVEPQRAHDRAIARMLDADVLVALPGHDLPAAVSGKLYEYLRSRRPVLLVAGEGAATELARRVGLRHVVRPDDPRGLDAALDDLASRKAAGTLHTASDPAVVATLDRATGAAHLARLLETGSTG